MSTSIKLRRSFHYVPGGYQQLLEGASKVPADVICFDLEDSVPAPGKVAAREQVSRCVLAQDFGPREVVIRVNDFGTPWGEADVTALASLPIDGILLPKAESAAYVQKAAALAEAAGASPRLRFWCQIETPRGVLRAEEIALSHPRVVGFVIGGSDLAETLHARHTPQRLPLLGALSHTLLVARAHGLAIIDAVHPNYKNDDGFAESCRQAAELGFDGKSVAFARQIMAANAAFGPSAEALAQAKQSIAGAAAGGAQSGYDNLHLAHARQVVEFAEAIAARAEVNP
jgi:citrate lyase subunit beta/citryl-CoA lyase